MKRSTYVAINDGGVWASVRWPQALCCCCCYASSSPVIAKLRKLLMSSSSMAASRASSYLVAVLLVLASSLLDAAPAAAERYPALAKGLSFDFYKSSCPKAESIARDFLASAAKQNPGLLPALIRLHFHDCFVQGCDASLLLDGAGAEQQAPPNIRLRPTALRAINDLRARLDKACGGTVVSCSDILALAARDSIVFSGGPKYRVPLGRRDSPSFATRQEVLDGLPPPTAHVPALMKALSKIGLDTTDLVALSGGHTVGIAHCTSFENRLFPAQDPTLNATFAGHLRKTCPAKGTDRRTVLDVRTPNAFDNKYYVNLVNREGLLTSDQDLYTNAATRPIVECYARDQKAFFDQFAVSVVKMGQINVLTGSQGQIRTNCSRRNPGAAMPPSHLNDAIIS